MTKQKACEIVLATTNPGKLAELRTMLKGYAVVVRGLREFGRLAEAKEDGEDFAENARGKARHYAELLDRWVLADDSGLEIDALGGAPGVYSARFAGVDSADRAERDRANNEKVLRLLEGVVPEERTGRFRCCLCLRSPQRIILEVQGTVEGVITTAPRGRNGFGYDPIFWVPELGKTIAELTAEAKNGISHRGRALRKLLERLPEKLG